MNIHSTEYKGDVSFVFEAKTNYGRTLMYPKNNRAKSLCDWAGVKALSSEKAKYFHENIVPLLFETSKEEWYETA